jgi:peptide deformylase
MSYKSLLDIIKYPDLTLKKKAVEVTDFDEQLDKFLLQMINTMYAARGIGLAAPQVGVLKRIVVIDLGEREESNENTGLIELINPIIVSRRGSATSEEGCLSIPKFRETIKRHAEITVEAYDRKREKFTLSAKGLFSFCLQHEIDHLDGILFTDHLSRLKKHYFQKWLKEEYDSSLSD